MPAALHLHFRRPPGTLRNIRQALMPSPGFSGRFPDMAVTWRGLRADRGRMAAWRADFLRTTGLQADHALPSLFVHSVTFRAHMALITHPRFPFPVWEMLQIRNHLLRHRPLDARTEYRLEVRTTAQRVLERGAELDLCTTLWDADGVAWESLNTYYHGGRHWTERPDPDPPLRASPAVNGPEAALWRMAAGGAWRFARLTGDFNPVHLWDGYARRRGYEGAFYHPQRVIGQCLARLPDLNAESPERLDVWVKGPVYHGRQLRLHVTRGPEETRFSLFCGAEDRPQLVGRHRLVQKEGAAFPECDSS